MAVFMLITSSNLVGCSMGRSGRLGDGHHEHIDVEAGEFGGEGGKPFESAISEAILQANVLSLNVAEFAESLLEPVE